MNSNTEIGKRDLKKSPISQLVFYMTSPEYNESLKLKAEGMLYERLTRKYKIYPDKVKTLVERDKRIMLARGYDLNNYMFGKSIIDSYDKLFKAFYENAKVKFWGSDIVVEDSKITISEMAEFCVLFLTYLKRYEARQKKFQTALERNPKKEISILNSKVSFKTKEQQIAELRKLSNTLRSRMYNEGCLINYNKTLADRMSTDIWQVTGEPFIPEFEGLFSVEFERPLPWRYSLEQKEEAGNYKDINWDAFSYYTALLDKYKVSDVRGCAHTK